MQIANLENLNRRFTAQAGPFRVLEYQSDLSNSPQTAQMAYFMAQMGVHRRQLVIDLNHTAVVIQAGAMQWMSGQVKVGTGIKGVGDLLGKAIRGAVTKEAAVKPEYQGQGLLVLEPTYKYIILEDLASWGPAGVTLEDGMFYACEAGVKQRLTARKTLSSAAFGGEGLFNLSLVGSGVAALESNVPRDELIEVTLHNDELKIDGNLALCWSTNLEFTVERSTRSLIGSAMSGEGLVNVYRGSGKVLISPVTPTSSLWSATNSEAAKAAAKNSNTLGH
ncbi:AIM24 family protein [Oscillospiraceae bacterium HV4-5-C5C]|nr:AIM24 family protein [Oscillospiraceae bacterium HV4-5-C5C]